MAIKKTELYIEKRQIDLYGDEAFLLNFNVADITDISAKASSYSKELTIPATNENNQIFSHLFNVNSEGYFNPITKKRAELYIDGVCVMRGYFKLNSINIIDNEYVTYLGVIYEDAINFIETLGDLELGNLDLPLTQTLAIATGSTFSIQLNTPIGTPFIFLPPVGGPNPSPARRIYHIQYNNLTTSNASLVNFTTIPKTMGSVWNTALNQSPNTVRGIQAISPITLNLTAAVTLSSTRSIKRGFVKATLVNGDWVHTFLGGSPITSSGTVFSQSINTSLNAGDVLYYYFAYSNGQNYTGTTPPPPMPLVNSTVGGTMQLSTSQVVNYLTLSDDVIYNNMNNAVDALNSDICFPIIDYNQTYPYTAVSTEDENDRPALKINFEELRPAVFVKKVWDAVFKQAGFKYKSKFLNDNPTLFKKLVMIGGMEEDEVQSLQYESVFTGGTYELTEPPTDDVVYQLGNTPGIYIYKSFMLGGNTSPTGTTTYWNTTLQRGVYTEKIKTFYSYPAYDYVPASPDYGTLLRAKVSGKYKVEALLDIVSKAVRYGSNPAPVDKQTLTYRVVIERIKGGSKINDPDLFTQPSLDEWSDGHIKTYTFTRVANQNDQPFQFKIDETFELKKGDLVRVKLLCSAEKQFDPSQSDSTAYQSKTNILSGSYVRYYRLGSWTGYQATSLTNMLPRSMKQADFILGITKMFNLYIEPDKQDPKTLFIEPRDTYFEDGRVLNWEKKLDYSKPIDLSILSHDHPKNYVFKFTDDGDDFNTEQFKKFNTNGLTFGSYKFVSPNEYVTETEEVELPFSAGYLQKVSGTDPLANQTTSDVPMVITKIVDKQSFDPDYDGDASSWEKQPRILYYGGKINLPQYDRRNYDFKLVGTTTAGVEYEIDMSYYTYAGHYDKPLEPTLDINFFTDTHYLETTYWKNGIGNATTGTTSTTSINLSTLVVNNNVVINIPSTPATYFNVNAAVNKYIKVYSNANNNHYFIGQVLQATTTTLTIKVLLVNPIPAPTTAINSWKVVLTNVEMKNDLFSIFYKQQMIELTDQTARLMKCNMYLTPVDIANFRFNDVIYAHGEYWRIVKVIDYDTSSDINQTTQVELVKLLRAQTNTLIDYLQGGYLGLNGGTPGGVSGNGGILVQGGFTPAVVAMVPNGTPGVYTANTDQLLSLYRNSITQDGNGVIPSYFASDATQPNGLNSLKYTVVAQAKAIQDILAEPADKPIGESITYEDRDAGNQTIDGRYSQVYFDVEARNLLFIMTLQDVAANDGFTVRFDALNDTTTTFMQVENGNATSNEIFVINSCNSVVAKYDATKEKWIISRG